MVRSLVPFVFDAGYPVLHGDPLLFLHREVNRLFDDTLRGSGTSGASATLMMAPPRMDISETGQDIRIEMELPGASEQDVHVEPAGDRLTIYGEKRPTREDAQHHVAERSFGRCSGGASDAGHHPDQRRPGRSRGGRPGASR